MNKSYIESDDNTIRQDNERVLNLFYICICSLFITLGFLSNFISFFVFLKTSRKAPTIVTKNLLIIFTISNSLYLITFWYYGILPKLIQYLENEILRNLSNSTYVARVNKTNLFFKSIHLVNTNKYMCKFITYLLGISILLNALITVMFSLERAVAINFPLKMRNFRENYRSIFHSMIIFVIVFSILYPTYNLYLADVVIIPLMNGTSISQCDIPEKYGKIYFNLTIIFVIETLALPFLLITVSNASILMAIYKNKQNFDGEKSGSFKSKGSTKKSNSSSKFTQRQRSTTSIKSRSKFNSSCRIGKGDKNAKLTRMLVAISLSFVLFHLPYFICWCVFANFRLNNQMKPLPDDIIIQMTKLYDYLKLSEILNLFNYSITGLLYFATGKIYRQHLFSILSTLYKCKKVDFQSSTYTYHTYNS